MKRWGLKPLKEFCLEIEDRCGERDLPVFSVSKNLGILPQAERFKKRIASADTSRYKVVRPGDFAFDPMLLWSGSISRHTSKAIGVVSPAYCVFRMTNGLDPRFLHLYLTHPDRLPFYDSISFGTNERRRKAQFSDFAELEIPVPPIKEQERIVKLLDEADELRKLRTQADRRTTALIPALFHEMFGDPVSNPKGHSVHYLEEICNRITDGTHQPPPFIEKGIPFLFVRNIVSGYIDFDTEKFITEETFAELTRRIKPERGDILYSTVGSYGVAVQVETDRKFAFQRHIGHLKPNRQKIDSGFLVAQLNTPSLKSQADQSARGIAQKTVNLADIRKFRLVVPPLSLQKRFAARVSEIRVLQAEQAASRRRLDDLFESMLHLAFNGEL